MIHARTPAAILTQARRRLGLTRTEAATRIGAGRTAWSNREKSCTPRHAAHMLSALHGAPWVCVEAPGWAVAGPEPEMRAALLPLEVVQVATP